MKNQAVPTVGDIIEFESGLKYKVLKVFDGGFIDIQALDPPYDLMPDFFPVYYSIKIKNYKIITENKQNGQPHDRKRSS